MRKMNVEDEQLYIPKGGILWINNEKSPYRRASLRAYRELSESSLVVITRETVGIEGPVFEFEGQEYRGIREIENLIKSIQK
ncbi:MAG: hypothetical protein QW478_12730 [Candidatus Micrarchaeaceae archaeon]